jgi:hypothetical protein
MSRTQGIGDFDSKRQDRIHVQGASHDAVLERHTVKEFHDEEQIITLMPDLMDGADVGMVSRGSSAGLATKTFQSLQDHAQNHRAGI